MKVPSRMKVCTLCKDILRNCPENLTVLHISNESLIFKRTARLQCSWISQLLTLSINVDLASVQIWNSILIEVANNRSWCPPYRTATNVCYNTLVSNTGAALYFRQILYRLKFHVQLKIIALLNKHNGMKITLSYFQIA